MILKIIFKINFLFENLHNRGVCRRSLGLEKEWRTFAFRGTLPFLTFLQAPQTRIEGIAQVVSQEIKAKHS